MKTLYALNAVVFLCLAALSLWMFSSDRAWKADSLEREARYARALAELKIPEPCQCAEQGAVEGEKFGAGGRLLPKVKDLTSESHEAVIEVRQFVRDIREGRLSFKISGSVWKGEATVTLVKE